MANKVFKKLVILLNVRYLGVIFKKGMNICERCSSKIFALSMLDRTGDPFNFLTRQNKSFNFSMFLVVFHSDPY